MTESKRCPMCGSLILEGQNKCTMCGYELPRTQDQSSDQSQSMKRTVFWSPSGNIPNQPKQNQRQQLPNQPAKEEKKLNSTMYWAPGTTPSPNQAVQEPSPPKDNTTQKNSENKKPQKTMFWSPGNGPNPMEANPTTQSSSKKGNNSPSLNKTMLASPEMMMGQQPNMQNAHAQQFQQPSQSPNSQPINPPNLAQAQNNPINTMDNQSQQPYPQTVPSGGQLSSNSDNSAGGGLPPNIGGGFPGNGEMGGMHNNNGISNLSEIFNGASLKTNITGGGLFVIFLLVGVIFIVLNLIPFIGQLAAFLGLFPLIPVYLIHYIFTNSYIKTKDNQKVKFSWDINWGEYWLGSLGRLILIVLTLGIYAPWYFSWLYLKATEDLKLKLGDSNQKLKLKYTGEGSDLFMPLWLGPFLVKLVSGIIFAILLTTLAGGSIIAIFNGNIQNSINILSSISYIFFLMILLYTGVTLYFDALFLNMTWDRLLSKTSIKINNSKILFKYKESTKELLKINIIGILLMVVTLGIYYSWWMANLIKALYNNTKTKYKL